ncbi:MAG TPA: hypothetical protein VKK81_01800 [Candidatus Binatia bacterium]|nr:hypothetical protein [Candidatus Binatia bacterium]
MTKPRLSRFVFNCVLSLFALVISLGCAEWLFLVYERTRFSAGYMDEHGIVDLHALNYNDTTVPVAKPADEWRVLSFGDSFAYSITTYDYSYSGVAAGMVNAAKVGPKVRIVNLGEPATSVNDYRAAYQYWAAILHHDVAIFNIYLGNDLSDIAFKYTPPQWTPNSLFNEQDFNIADGSARSHIPHKFPLRIFDYTYAYSRAFLYAQRATEAKVPDPRYNIAADNEFTHFPEELFFTINKEQLISFDFSRIDTLLAGYAAVYEFMRFASDLRQNGKQVLITLAPSESQADPALRARLKERYHIDLTLYDWSLPARIIREIGTQVDARIPVVDLTGYFQCRAEAGETLYHPGNTHWNLEGNALAGQVIARWMLQNWLDAPALVSQDLQTCVAQKEGTEPKISTATIHAFIANTLLPALRNGAEKRAGQWEEDRHVLVEPGE